MGHGSITGGCIYLQQFFCELADFTTRMALTVRQASLPAARLKRGMASLVSAWLQFLSCIATRASPKDIIALRRTKIKVTHIVRH